MSSVSNLKVISLGAGVQSSYLYQIAARGELGELPVAAIFADTGDEPQSVYDHLDYLEQCHGSDIPIIRASVGHLSADVLSSLGNDGCGHIGQPPFFVRADKQMEITSYDVDFTGSVDFETGQGSLTTVVTDERQILLPLDDGGMLWRKCTGDYKITPIRRAVREIWEKNGKVGTVEQLIGISFDELHRMKESGVGYIVNKYPLVEMKITRQQCADGSKARGYRPAPKSACRWCPFKSDVSWAYQKEYEPAEFEKSCDFDDALRADDRRLPGVQGKVYVHRSFTPLRMVNFDIASNDGKNLGFDNECEGMCGL